MPHVSKEHPKWKPRQSSKWARAEFVAWDGEGETDPATGEHRYVMLCNSLGHQIINPAGIPTGDCLDMLTAVGHDYPHAIHVCYGASYDVNMMLRDLPRGTVQHLWQSRGRQTMTHWGEYELLYRPRKEFRVSRLALQDGRPVWQRQGSRWSKITTGKITLWDVFGFFQGTFVAALEKHLGAGYELLEQIKAGKARRSQFTPEERETTLAYCRAELAALVELMERLHAQLEYAGLPISRWDGAGAVAASLLKREGVKAHMEVQRPGIRRAAQSAYSGGRIELGQYGHFRGTVHHYDINSAYPAAIARLPSLAGGTWERSQIVEEYSLNYVTWELGPARFYPFHYRLPDGRILYPSTGAGWQWGPVVSSALRALGMGSITGRIDVHQSYTFRPVSDQKPFAFVPALFELRAQWKRDGIGAEKVLKLGLNSLYGKMVQQVGTKEGQPPAYHQLEWGGYVTAWTRAQLYNATIQAPQAIIMLATDGIFATEPLDVPLGHELGTWEYSTHDALLAVQSGVYWHWPEPESNFYCRGFDRGSLAWERVLQAMKQGRDKYAAELTRFITMGSALASDAQWEHWRRWRTVPKDLTLRQGGTKRMDITDLRAHDQLIPTAPAPNPLGMAPSAPYAVRWEQPDLGEWDGIAARIIDLEVSETNV